MSKSKAKPLLGKIKEAIDAVYEMTVTPGGYHGHFKDYPTTFWRVVAVLVQRKIVSRERQSGDGRTFVYKWVATMHPTATLYKSVEQEIRDKVRAYAKNAKSKEKKGKKGAREETPAVATAPVVETPSPAPVKKEFVTSLDGFSAQELWDELKKRGFGIEGDRIVKKAYLN